MDLSLSSLPMASLSLSFSSSILPSPISQEKCRIQHSPNPRPQDPIFRVIRCAIAAPTSKSASSSSSVGKKRHWKQGEFPGTSETSLPGSQKRSPIKNVKKKLDRKAKAKAWVSTVTETLSDRVEKKQWVQALEVIGYLTFEFA